MRASEIQAEYRRLQLYYAELLETSDIELAPERGKAMLLLGSFKRCAEGLGVTLEATP